MCILIHFQFHQSVGWSVGHPQYHVSALQCRDKVLVSYSHGQLFGSAVYSSELILLMIIADEDGNPITSDAAVEMPLGMFIL